MVFSGGASVSKGVGEQPMYSSAGGGHHYSSSSYQQPGGSKGGLVGSSPYATLAHSQQGFANSASSSAQQHYYSPQQSTATSAFGQQQQSNGKRATGDHGHSLERVELHAPFTLEPTLWQELRAHQTSRPPLFPHLTPLPARDHRRKRDRIAKHAAGPTSTLPPLPVSLSVGKVWIFMASQMWLSCPFWPWVHTKELLPPPLSYIALCSNRGFNKGCRFFWKNIADSPLFASAITVVDNLCAR